MNIYTLIFILVLVAMVVVGVIAWIKGKKPSQKIEDGLCEIKAESADKED